MVDGLPDAFGYRGPPQDYIQITLASDFDIVAEGNGNIYAFMGRCPFNADLQRMVLGPLAAGEPPADLFGVGEVMPRRPDGRAGYVLYVRVGRHSAASERRKISNLPELAFGYDLVADREDLCLQIRQSGYFITASRSQTIRIPYSDMEGADHRRGHEIRARRWLTQGRLSNFQRVKLAAYSQPVRTSPCRQSSCAASSAWAG